MSFNTGHQQLLFILIGVILAAIAVFGGLSHVTAHVDQSNKDGITASLLNIAGDAYRYRLSPSSLAGGNNAYSGYAIPSRTARDKHGVYLVERPGTRTLIVFKGISTRRASWTVTCSVDSLGVARFVYDGW